MRITDIVNERWCKSSYSGQGGDCLEVSHAGCVASVRDSKRAEGPVLAFPADAWGAFLSQLKAQAAPGS
jgi:hypothetical protein